LAEQPDVICEELIKCLLNQMKHGKPPEIPGNNQVFDGEINPEFCSKSYVQVLFYCCMSLSQILMFLLEIQKVCISFVLSVKPFVTEVS
jgi:hypothetical protein